MSSSKVTVCTPGAPFNTSFGELFPFNVVLENGDKGQYNSKYQDQKKVQVGQTIEYTLDLSNVNFPKIKLAQQGNFQNGGSKGGFQRESFEDKMIDISMGYAKDMFCAGKIEGKDLEAKFKKIYNIMLDFRKEITPAPAPKPVEPNPFQQQEPPPPMEEPGYFSSQPEPTDELPF